MFGLDWFVLVVTWSGVDNISFSYENGLVWIWFGFVCICRLTCVVLICFAGQSETGVKPAAGQAPQQATLCMHSTQQPNMMSTRESTVSLCLLSH